MNNLKEYTIKIVIIGEPGVGKTSLIRNAISGRFSKDYRATIGCNMFIKRISLDKGEKVKVQAWDIAGQERWTQMRHIYYNGAQGAMIVGDLTRYHTFVQIEEFWFPDLKKFCENIPIVLIANKTDLKEKKTLKEIEILRYKLKALDVIYTSAITGENVEKAFRMIAKNSI